ncbi:unnamed protein product [Brugia timori]|uniref:Ovule protein n=1 Tax=Brugia timori TaxID=42155 RepID=A0A0R3QDE3_9BILA|nr:unnamed protein product [Brugia timori]
MKICENDSSLIFLNCPYSVLVIFCVVTILIFFSSQCTDLLIFSLLKYYNPEPLIIGKYYCFQPILIKLWI